MFFEDLIPPGIFRAGVYSLDKISLHWKKTLVLLYVLEGEIQVRIDDESHLRKKGDVDIINPGEMRAYEGEEGNRVLFIELRPEFFEDYVEGANEIYYYVDERDTEINAPKYVKLRLWMMMLAFEYFFPKEDSGSFSEGLLVDLMYHLLNQFHYLYYEQQDLRDDLSELKRFHRIFTYLDVNFREGASLQELAEQEFLSPSYLSYKIKDTLGLNFHDYLGALRSEAGAKLLLSTDKSVSEIALDVGFSHPRYFMKHFEEVYHKTPQEFREIHGQKSEEFLLLTPDSKEFLEELKGESRYSSQQKPKIFSVDLKKEVLGPFERAQTLFLGEAVYYLESETQQLLHRAQREIGFKKGILEQLFCQDMDIYRGSSRRFYNWTRVKKVLDLLIQVALEPQIVCQGVESHVLEDFIKTFRPLYPEIETWLTLEPSRKLLFSPGHDQIGEAARIIKNRGMVPVLMDQITRETLLENDTFFGGEGLFTANFLAKPSYYAYKFLSLMGEELLEEGPGYLVTQSEEGYQVLFYKEEDQEIRPAVLNLYGIEEAMGLSRFLLSPRYGSIYDAWKDLGSPERLGDAYWYLLDDYVHPILEFDYVPREIVFSLRSKNDFSGITLYLFKKLQNV